jgi:transcriptional regulator with XRE-family HTH domain
VSTFSKLWIKLRNRAYRNAFVAAQLKRGIPFQLRVMRKKLGLSQADVARLAGVSQGVISRAEDSDYGNLTFNNVLRIAAGLDVAFVGRLVPFSDLARWFDNLSEESVQVSTFDEEDQRLEGLGTTVDVHIVHAPVAFSLGDLYPQQITRNVCSVTTTTTPVVGAFGLTCGTPTLVVRQCATQIYYGTKQQEAIAKQVGSSHVRDVINFTTPERYARAS